MLRRLSPVLLLLLAALPACSQSDPEQDIATDEGTQARMLTPPPISGQTYSNLVGVESRRNYLNAGLAYSTGYIHNLYAGSSGSPINDTANLIQPNISLDQSTGRVHETLVYNPSFAIYHPTSQLNNFDQNVSEKLLIRLSPHVTLVGNDLFQRTSSAFGSGLTGTPSVAGSTQGVTPGVVAPFAPEIANQTNGEISWQFSADDMVAASGMFSTLNFTSPQDAEGLYNSTTSGGTGAYSHRLLGEQYVGAVYQYSRVMATPLRSVGETAQAETQTDNVFGFYTVYFRPTFSISLVGGPQYYTLSQPSGQPVHAWNPAGMISLGWQGPHTGFAASGSRMVTGGSGVVGAYQTSQVQVTGRWKMSRTWMASVAGSFSKISNAAPEAIAGTITGGHTISASASIDRSIGSNIDVVLAYTNLHQNYSDITALAVNPESDSILVSLNYRFSRPLGR